MQREIDVFTGPEMLDKLEITIENLLFDQRWETASEAFNVVAFSHPCHPWLDLNEILARAEPIVTQYQIQHDEADKHQLSDDFRLGEHNNRKWLRIESEWPVHKRIFSLLYRVGEVASGRDVGL